jgi:hypothetical protein
MALWTLTVQLASTEGARFPVVPTQAVVPVILAVIAIPTTFHRTITPPTAERHHHSLDG